MSHLIHLLLRRQSSTPAPESSGDVFLNLVANPFQTQVSQTSFFAALIYSFVFSSLLGALFCLLRPRVSHIYAPRAKHADAKHAPPQVGRGFFSWLAPVKSVHESELIEKIGVDATIFLRFLRMLRNIFLIFAPIGCAIMFPVNLAASVKSRSSTSGTIAILAQLTPQAVGGSSAWAYVAVAYIFTGIFCYFLWRNYAIITKFRRDYFESPEYQSSLHSRSLMITHVPDAARTDEGLTRLVEQARATGDIPKASIARNVKDLPELVEDHEEAVHSLEKYLAKYLRDPNHLPKTRPACSPAKGDRAHSGNHKVDAIDYLTGRIARLEQEIRAARESIDRRNPLPYGFVSYKEIADAHAVAYAARKKGPEGTNVKLAPKPIALIWKNLPLTRGALRVRRMWTNLWVVILTVIYIGPNVLTSVFLADLAHLGQVWPGFANTLHDHPTWWALVQGIAAPSIQNGFYLVLPTIFRRLLSRGGDKTKTSRERHVLSKLYAFNVFNNLIVFSIFSSVWQFIAALVEAKNQDVVNVLESRHPIDSLVYALCNISPYWVTWQLLRNLSAALDLIQAWPLLMNTFAKKFLNPSPRRLIELTAPQPFLYAEYYANYMLVATVALSYSTIQPLVLPTAAFYIALDYWLKKYLLQYVFITRIESGGSFWRTLYNRCLFALFLFQVIVALLLWSKGTHTMLFAMIPLPLLLIGFKVFCARTFDTTMNYFAILPISDVEKSMPLPQYLGGHSRNSSGADRVATRFGHPALYKKLITPMVNAKAQHILPQIYRGRLEDDEVGGFNDAASTAGYSDVYMTEMSKGHPGKTTRDPRLPFEFVTENELDFENFKGRSDFRADFGGQGELYGRADDNLSRPTTPGSMMSGLRMGGKTMRDDGAGTSYPLGYHIASNSGDAGIVDEEDRGRLVSRAAAMGRHESPSGASFIGATPLTTRESPDRGGIRGYFDRSSRGQYQYFGDGDASQGFGSGRATPAEDVVLGGGAAAAAVEDATSYDYFRRGARGVSGGGARPDSSGMGYGHAATGSGGSGGGSRPGTPSNRRPLPGDRTRM